MQQNSNSQELEPELELECPSFNTYSTTNLSAQNAAAADPDSDFEFSCPTTISEQIFPLFNRNLLLNDKQHDILVDYRNPNDALSCDRIPLEKLFLDDRNSSSSESESEDGELGRVPPETYCIWKPRSPSPSSPSCEKSNSTGTSASGRVVKKWRLRDLMMRRSKSDGKESFMFLKREKVKEKEKEERKSKDKNPKSSKTAVVSSGSEKKMFYYMKNDDKKRKSYLPYRPELVGFFGNGYGSVRMN